MASQAIPASHNRAPSTKSGRVRREVRVAVWPMALLIYAAILPREVAFNWGGLFLYADRLALIILLPYVIRKLMDGAIRFVLPDMLVLVASLWLMVSMIQNYGFAQGLKSGGALAYDATVGYYLARISFRSLQDMRKVLILVAPGFLIAGLLVLVESVLHRYIVQEIVEKVFSALPDFGRQGEAKDSRAFIRIGLMRGKGPFNHSIHAGLCLASILPLYIMSGLRGWPKVTGIVAALLSFFTLSSAAVLSLMTNAALVAYDHVQRATREMTWRGLIIVGTIVTATINLVSDSGVAGLVGRYLTFDPFTAYYRQLTWRYGTQSVWAHPWFGIGFETYQRPTWMVSDSIDAHWLLLAMRFGLVAAVGYFLASVMALISVSRASVAASYADQKFYRGIAISLFSMAFAMFSVALWGNLQTWYNVLLGGCVACSQHTYRRVRIEQTASEP